MPCIEGYDHDDIDNSKGTSVADNTSKAVQKVEVEPMADPQVVWLRNGAPLLIPAPGATQGEVEAWAYERGFQIFFVLGQTEHKREYKKGNVTTIEKTYEPGLFKVVKNLAGRATVELKKGDLGLSSFAETAYFSLPKVPLVLIEKMDRFFRAIDDKLGTEAIVILTYDPTYDETDNPSEGWGMAVPKQENTAGSCDYDQTTVVDDLPDGVYVVGSAHSHPGMSAFASHTDHGDQANFDGVHITFGWNKHTRVTDFHIELQMAGGTWTLTPEQAFQEPDEAVEEDPEIAEWMERVKKAPPPITNNWHGRSTGTGSYQATGGYSAPKVIKDSDRSRYKNLPSWAPTPREVTLVMAPMLQENDITACPICDRTLSAWDKEGYKCSGCTGWFKPLGVTWEDMIRVRKAKNLPWRDLDFPVMADHKVVVLEETAPQGGGKGSHYWASRTVFDPNDKDSWKGQSPLWADRNGGGSGKADAGGDSGFPWVRCLACGEDNGPDDVDCFACKAPLRGQAEQQAIDDHEAALDATLQMPVPMLCCEEEIEDCICPDEARLSFDDAMATFDEMNAIAEIPVYAPDGGCDGCALQFDGHCPPLRGWLDDWMFRNSNEGLPKPLFKCDHFIPESPLTLTIVDPDTDTDTPKEPAS